MSAYNDSSFENSLKCDFPARESFREALLENLLSMDGSELDRAMSDESEGSRKNATRKVKLEDADLEMLAAAEGEERVFRNPFEE